MEVRRSEELLPVAPTAPLLARRILHQRLRRFVGSERLDEVKLAASEVVTNAVMHSGTSPDETLGMVVERREGRVRIEVQDNGYGFEKGRGRRQKPNGPGLQIVEALADRWGVEPGPPTYVWFEVDVEPLASR
jgi:anti-sigma regulatory factor (Ser/Thr protein kinase)